MNEVKKVNDFVIKFANVNGTGSSSANHLFAKSIFRMGVPVAPRNIFPSNIQGLPTWYEVRVNDKGFLGRREGIDVMVAMNPQSMQEDYASVLPGGYFVFDSTMPLPSEYARTDITHIGIPLAETCLVEYSDPRQRLLFKNVMYVGALAALLDMDFEVIQNLVGEQFKGKEKLIAPNIHALELGYQFAKTHFDCPLSVSVEKSDAVGERIMMEGNAAIGLGAVYAGATVAGWYPITPSTSVVDAFATYCKRLRIDPGTGEHNYAIIQAEDELAAMGMVIGACWNGARAFTATSGPGVSLMSEFLGLAYFAEVPAVLIDVQRAGPSTGMPTRSQQSDVLLCAYASHGDTKHVLLFPASPKECFDMTAEAFDLAERLQTPVIMMTDLELGMNDCLCDPLQWDDARRYDRGKVLDAKGLEEVERFGRYLDVDGDGICYRTYPGAHPTKGAFFTRGTSRDPYAVYTEKGELYVENMERLTRKFKTAERYVPAPEIQEADANTDVGVIYYGTTDFAMAEALQLMAEKNVLVDTLRIRAFPFNDDVRDFIKGHRQVFVIEQNRDGQLKTLLVNELGVNPAKLHSVLSFDGMPIVASLIAEEICQKVHEPTPLKAAGER